MSLWAIAIYAVVLALALFLLVHFKAQAWYWHVLSALLALGVGLVPPPAGWQGPLYDVLFGCTFLFLFVWGLGGILMYRTHEAHHTRHRHA